MIRVGRCWIFKRYIQTTLDQMLNLRHIVGSGDEVFVSSLISLSNDFHMSSAGSCLLVNYRLGWFGCLADYSKMHTNAWQVHPREAYDTFRNGLLVNHTEHEKAYVHVLEKADKIQSLKQDPVQADVWGLTYHLPWPLKRRYFLEAVFAVELPRHSQPLSSEHLSEVRSWLGKDSTKANVDATDPSVSGEDYTFRSFLVISLPVHLPNFPAEAKGKVLARYASVEAVIEEPDSLEWCMVTQSDAGGWVKPWLANSSMAKTIAADVPSFCNWAAEQFFAE